MHALQRRFTSSPLLRWPPSFHRPSPWIAHGLPMDRPWIPPGSPFLAYLALACASSAGIFRCKCLSSVSCMEFGCKEAPKRPQEPPKRLQKGPQRVQNRAQIEKKTHPERIAFSSVFSTHIFTDFCKISYRCKPSKSCSRVGESAILIKSCYSLSASIFFVF